MGWLGIRPARIGAARKALREAILAGTDRDTLRLALSDAANSREYEHLVAEADFSTEVDELIGKAWRQGWLDELVMIISDTTERADIKAQLQAAAASLAQQQGVWAGGDDTGSGPKLDWRLLVAAGLAIVLLLGAVRLFWRDDPNYPDDPNYVVRLEEGGEPAEQQAVFVIDVLKDGKPGPRFDRVTNVHGEAYFSLELGGSKLYLVGVRYDDGSECTFPAFNVHEKRGVQFQLDSGACKDGLSGVKVRSGSSRLPVNASLNNKSADFPLPTDLAARVRRAPFGLPAAPFVLDRLFYTLGFDPKIRSPRWASFTVDTQRTLRLPRLGTPFAFDPDLPQPWQTGEDVYRGNSYDRGTLIMRSDALIGTTEAEARASEAQVFYYSVTVPQTDVTNQRSWLSVEQYTREASASLGPIHVISGPIYPDLTKANSAYLTLGSSRTVVPLSLFRVLLRKTATGEWRAVAFLVPNDGSDARDPKIYATSVAAIEAATGLTFFPGAPNDLTEALKANASLDDFER